MSVPLIVTSPLSGRSSPSRCLRKTDLPPPLRPMITVMEPSGTSRSTPRRTSWPPNDFVSPRTLITPQRSRKDRPQEVVPDEDQDRGEDDGLRGGAGDTFGAVADVEALVGRHPRDDGPEGERLPEARHDVVEIHEGPHLTEVGAFAETEQLYADQITAEDAHDVEERRHHRERHDAGQNRRRDQITKWIERHHGERVDLLGDPHDADLGGQRRAGPPGDHQRGQHRAELADQRERDRRTEKRLRAEARERQIHLQAEHHAGEGASEDDDQERAIADVVHTVDEGARLERRRDHREQGEREEAPETTEHLDEVDRPPPDGLGASTTGRDEGQQRPRGLARRRRTTAGEAGVVVTLTRLAPAAVPILVRLQPAHGALDVLLVEALPDRFEAP